LSRLRIKGGESKLKELKQMQEGLVLGWPFVRK